MVLLLVLLLGPVPCEAQNGRWVQRQFQQEMALGSLVGGWAFR